MTDEEGVRMAHEAGPESDISTTQQDRAILLRWIVAVTIGEALGFAVAAGVAIGTMALGVPDPWRYLVIVIGGAAEGALLGAAQVNGMGDRRPDARGWIAATAAGAAVAWSIGMLPSTVQLQFATPVGVALVALAGLVLVATIPTAQWLVIRRRERTLRWIPVNVGAWAAGILWTFAPSPLIDESTPLGILVAVYAVAGLLMALTVAALTATTARMLFSTADR